MPTCKCGCGEPVPASRTKTFEYASPACRAREYRRRRKLLQEMGIDELINSAQQAVDAWRAGQPLIAGLEFNGLEAAMASLAAHPILAGSQAGEPEILSSHPLAVIRIGNGDGQGGGKETMDERRMTEAG
jgi:hypothetical protein